MQEYTGDIYTERNDFEFTPPITLDLLRAWRDLGRKRGRNPKPEGPRKQAFVERIELQPIDPQTSGIGEATPNPLARE